MRLAGVLDAGEGNVLLLSLGTRSTAELQVGTALETRAVSVFPRSFFPGGDEMQKEEEQQQHGVVVCFKANGDNSLFLLASWRGVVSAGMPSVLSSLSGKRVTAQVAVRVVAGKVKEEEEQRGLVVATARARRMDHVIGMEGEVVVETNSFRGRFWGRYEGEFELIYQPAMSLDEPQERDEDSIPLCLRQGALWVGRCKIMKRFDKNMNEHDMEMTVQNCSHGVSPGYFEASCILGDIEAKSIYPIAHSPQTSILQASWHPLNLNQFLILASDGIIRLYDHRSPHDLPELKVNFSSPRTREIPMRFSFPGDRLEIKENNESPSQLRARFWRYQTIFVLYEDGRIAYACPMSTPSSGVFSVQEISHLEEAAVSAQERSWFAKARIIMNEYSSNDEDDHLTIARDIATTPDDKNRVPGAKATSLLVSSIPTKAPLFGVLKTWSSGLLETFLWNGENIIPHWQGIRGLEEILASASSFSAIPTIKSKSPSDYSIEEARKHLSHLLVSSRKSDSPFANMRDKIQDSLKKSNQSKTLSLSSINVLPQTPRPESHLAPEEASSASNMLLLSRIELFDSSANPNLRLCLIPDKIYPDLVLCLDLVSGAIQMIWMQWIRRLVRGLTSEGNKYFSPSKLLIHPGHLSPQRSGDVIEIIAEPGLGHYLLVIPRSSSSDRLNLCQISLGTEFANLKNLKLYGDDDDEGNENPLFDAPKASPNEIQTSLELLCRIPPELRGRRILSTDTSPALNFAAGKYLTDLYEKLASVPSKDQILSNGSTKPLSIAATLQLSTEQFIHYRDQQDRLLDEQLHNLETIKTDLEGLKDFQKQTSQRIDELFKKLTFLKFGLDEVFERAKRYAIRRKTISQGADNEFSQNILEKVDQIEEEYDTLRASATLTLASEEKHRGVLDKKDFSRSVQSKVLKSKEILEDTSKILAKVLPEPVVPLESNKSSAKSQISSIREKIAKLRLKLDLSELVCFISIMDSKIMTTHKIANLCERSVLGYEYQSSQRRNLEIGANLEIDAKDLPYSLELKRKNGEMVIVRLCILGKEIEIREVSDDKNIRALFATDKTFDISSCVRVTPVYPNNWNHTGAFASVEELTKSIKEYPDFDNEFSYWRGLSLLAVKDASSSFQDM